MIEQIEAWLRRQSHAGIPADLSVSFLTQGTYDRLFLLEGAAQSLLLRVRLFSDESSGPGLEIEHEILCNIPPGIGPRPIHIDVTRRELPWPVRIEPFIRGRSPERFSEELLLRLAALLARLHARRYRRSGHYPGGEEPYRVGGTMTSLLVPGGIRSQRILTLIEQGRLYLEAHAPLYVGFDRFAIVHNDLHLGNILCREDGELALVDWEHSELADPASDIAALFWFNELMQGRTEGLSEPLRRCFLDEYVRLTGEQGLEARVRLHEPILLLLHAVSLWRKLEGSERLPEHQKTEEMIRSHQEGAEAALVLLEEEGRLMERHAFET